MKLAGSWQKPVTLCWQCWLVKLVLTLMMNTSQGQRNTSPANCTTVTLKRKEKLLKVTTKTEYTKTEEVHTSEVEAALVYEVGR